jgi:hypothetical protein
MPAIDAPYVQFGDTARASDYLPYLPTAGVARMRKPCVCESKSNAAVIRGLQADGCDRESMGVSSVEPGIERHDCHVIAEPRSTGCRII